MKKNILITFLILVSLKALSQENMVTISGGYSFGKHRRYRCERYRMEN